MREGGGIEEGFKEGFEDRLRPVVSYCSSLDRSQSLFCFVPQENLTAKLVPPGAEFDSELQINGKNVYDGDDESNLPRRKMRHK